jgi:hypothetical protein
MEESGELNVPAALSSGKDSPVSAGQEATRASEPI